MSLASLQKEFVLPDVMIALGNLSILLLRSGYGTVRTVPLFCGTESSISGPTKSRLEPSGRRPESSRRFSDTATRRLGQSRVESLPEQHETCYNVVAMRCYVLQFIVV